METEETENRCVTDLCENTNQNDLLTIENKENEECTSSFVDEDKQNISEDEGRDDTSTDEETENSDFKKIVERLIHEKEIRKKLILREALSETSKPVIGLDYILEIQSSHGEPNFECTLCEVKCGKSPRAIFNHITGHRHRCLYLKTVDEENLLKMHNSTMKKGDFNRAVYAQAKTLQETKGAGFIKVVDASNSDSSEKLKTVEDNKIERSITRESSSLKSTLDEYISKLNEPVVGLDHIIETQSPDSNPTFQCSLCKLNCDHSTILDHIVGRKHRSAYLKHIDEEAFVEIKSRSLEKGEFSKNILAYIKEHEKEKSSGSILVKSIPSSNQQGQKRSHNFMPSNTNDMSRKRPHDDYEFSNKRQHLSNYGYHYSGHNQGFVGQNRNNAGQNQNYNRQNLSLEEQNYIIQRQRLNAAAMQNRNIGISGLNQNVLQNFNTCVQNQAIGDQGGLNQLLGGLNQLLGTQNQNMIGKNQMIANQIAALNNLANQILVSGKGMKIVSEVVKALAQNLIQNRTSDLPDPVKELLLRAMNNEVKTMESILSVFSSREFQQLLNKLQMINSTYINPLSHSTFLSPPNNASLYQRNIDYSNINNAHTGMRMHRNNQGFPPRTYLRNQYRSRF